MAEFLKSIKQASVEAVDNTKPVQLCFGKVTGTSPLQILVEQKMTLSAAQLMLCRCVTDHTVEMTVDHRTENETEHVHRTPEGVSAPTSHRHTYQGTKRFTVHGALKTGEQVILLRMQGGQKYLVLDRLGKEDAG